MNKLKSIFILLLSTVLMTACVDDLDVTPKDPDIIMAGNLGDDPAYMPQVLGKIYASFIIAGQGANGGADISASDENFFTTMRALWNLQEITTDEAICAWGDIGIADLNTQTWSPSNPFLTALYQRLGLSITYANDFIALTKDDTDPQVVQYNAEARFLRALAYYWFMDLFGNPPYTTEEDGVGKFYPEQIQRAQLFDYVLSELKAIEEILPEAGNGTYPQADKGAVWMLLARTYLNAEVYTGTAHWDDCKTYCNKVINSGAYALAEDYRQNFSADNDYPTNPEMIFAWEQDGEHTQGYVGTTFIIESSSDATYIRAEDYHGLTSNTNWNGNRARIDFMNILVDTLATYGGPIDMTDVEFSKAKDKRTFMKMKLSLDIPSASSSGDYGIGVYKFTALNHDGSQPANYNAAYACTDFPIFRLADAYLMRAEANFNMGNTNEAVSDINIIRERAYGNTDGNITANELTSQFILNERGREFYYEAQRRTDLIRFGQFTDGTYNWQWKGGVFDGAATSNHLNLFPIPGDEVSANSNIQQNTGY
ncbi:RagB/SusD family nutrient uptake outer membrane protein [Maribellus mangrovi]|uniref:RagB/SusD family nutrient uptake outer membrane protein n=1 Tax=Maribellus mangrovi TaxID=3133146 RepID=UPI0030EF38D6